MTQVITSIVFALALVFSASAVASLLHNVMDRTSRTRESHLHISWILWGVFYYLTH